MVFNNWETKKLDSINSTESVITDIISQVEKSIIDEKNLGLFDGLAGKLLFLYYVYKYNGSLVNVSLFQKKLDFLVEGITALEPTFGTGMFGAAWFLELISQQQDEYDADLFSALDLSLGDTMTTRQDFAENEFTRGMAGFGVFIEKHKRFNHDTQTLRRWLEKLNTISIHFKDGSIAWNQPKKSVFRIGDDLHEFNLGMAHGICGITASILPCLKYDDLSSMASELVEGSCEFLISCISKKRDATSCISYTSLSKTNTRLGWCYGDLTTALTLARAGQMLNRLDFVEKAELIALHSAKRNIQSSMAVDAGICHGYSGIALLFKLLYEVLGDISLSEAANHWHSLTIELYGNNGISGLNRFNLSDRKFIPDFGFLNGYSGIGISLLSFINGDTEWAESLLLK